MLPALYIIDSNAS